MSTSWVSRDSSKSLIFRNLKFFSLQTCKYPSAMVDLQTNSIFSVLLSGDEGSGQSPWRRADSSLSLATVRTWVIPVGLQFISCIQPKACWEMSSHTLMEPVCELRNWNLFKLRSVKLIIGRDRCQWSRWWWDDDTPWTSDTSSASENVNLHIIAFIISQTDSQLLKQTIIHFLTVHDQIQLLPVLQQDRSMMSAHKTWSDVFEITNQW